MLKKLSLLIIMVVVIFCIFMVISKSNGDSTISINNDTDTTISGIKIAYSGSDNEISVEKILPKQTYRTQLVFPDNFTEGSIKIHYLDKNGQKHEEIIEGYIEKGYKKNMIVTIDSMDDNGVLYIKVQKGFLPF